MPHPTTGGTGNPIKTKHNFKTVFAAVGLRGVKFKSTTGEVITVTQSFAQDGKTPTLVFSSESRRHGNVCGSCWGNRKNCSGTRIGHCVEGLDNQIKP